MLFKPPILALMAGSLATSGLLLYAAGFGVHILKHWDIRSGSDLQLTLERRTYLVSTIMAYAFGFQLVSFFLFIATADRLQVFFTGAMCAVGSLNVNQWGFPVVMAKGVNFLLAGWWLIINYVDNQAPDYPLIRQKYLWLLVITPAILVEVSLQTRYFLELKPEVITSCCGTLFTSEARGMAAEMSALPHLPMEVAFWGSLAATLALGISFHRRGRGGYWFALVSFLTFLIALVSLISFISIYIYELPTHHCPFCILQREYSYIGYPIYILLLSAALAGGGVGLLMPFRYLPSLRDLLPGVQKQLVWVCLAAYAGFAALAAYQLAVSNLRM